MKKLFLIIGAPGSGKTTDAEIIAKEGHDITHFSTGELLRLEVSSKSERGLTIEGFINKGELVPLEIVVQTIIDAIKKSQTSRIIIDGYPRSVEQMMALDEILQSSQDVGLRQVFEVHVSQETAKSRVLGRSRGADDNEEVFYNRMQVYTKPLQEIQEFYKQKNLLTTIDGERTIEEIVRDIESHMD